MDSLKDAVKQASDALDGTVASVRSGLDSAISATASSALTGIAEATQTAKAALTEFDGYYSQAKGYVDVGTAHASAAHDAAFDALKHGIEYCATNPYIAYPVAATAALFALPPVRRRLYAATLGRFRTPESVAKAAAGRLEMLQSQATGVGAEATKLQARLTAAEEEYLRGLSKLRATRGELQRLTSQVSRAERAAENVIQDLREISGAPGTVQMRSNAASVLASLRQQRKQLEKAVWRVASRDI